MSPKRFTSRRGQKLAPGQKLVGRNTRWGNPFPVRGRIDVEAPPQLVRRFAEKHGVSVESLLCATAKEAVARYRKALLAGELSFGADDVREHLRGFDLGCPCKDEACHALVLLDIANV